MELSSSDSEFVVSHFLNKEKENSGSVQFWIMRVSPADKRAA